MLWWNIWWKRKIWNLMPVSSETDLVKQFQKEIFCSSREKEMVYSLLFGKQIFCSQKLRKKLVVVPLIPIRGACADRGTEGCGCVPPVVLLCTGLLLMKYLWNHWSPKVLVLYLRIVLRWGLHKHINFTVSSPFLSLLHNGPCTGHSSTLQNCGMRHT